MCSMLAYFVYIRLANVNYCATCKTTLVHAQMLSPFLSIVSIACCVSPYLFTSLQNKAALFLVRYTYFTRTDCEKPRGLALMLHLITAIRCSRLQSNMNSFSTFCIYLTSDTVLFFFLFLVMAGIGLSSNAEGNGNGMLVETAIVTRSFNLLFFCG